MENYKNRFNNLVKKKNAVQNLVSYLKDKCDVGDLILNEIDLKEKLGNPHQQTRQALIVLESFGYLEIQQGKPSTLIRSLSDDPLDVSEAVLKNRLKFDEKLKKLVEFISNNYKADSKLPGEGKIINKLDLKKDKLKEDLLRLECAGYIVNSHGRNRKIFKDLSFLLCT